MATCPNCGATKNPSTATVCAVCGKPILGSGIAMVKKGGASGSAMSVAPVLIQSNSGRRYHLGSSDTLVGSKGCAILLADPSVAPRHARVSPQGGGYLIEDLGGGVLINGAKIIGPSVLSPGDRVKLGTVELVYQGPAGTPTLVRPVSSISAPTIPSSPLKPVVRGSGPVPPWATAKSPDVHGIVAHVDYKTSQSGGSSGVSTYHTFWVRINTPSGPSEAVMSQLPNASVNLGDEVGLWGGWEKGVLKVTHAFNYTTKAVIVEPGGCLSFLLLAMMNLLAAIILFGIVLFR